VIVESLVGLAETTQPLLAPLFWGALGGAFHGVLSFVQNWKDGETFDLQKFVKSLAPGIIVGFSAGVILQSTGDAFLFGIIGKKVWETLTH